MRTSKALFYTLISTFIFLQANAQEVLNPLKYNTQLFNNRTVYSSPKKNTRSIDTILFFDDFYYCYKSKFADPTKWLPNNQVFINSTFPINPPTLGVATFDGINAYGIPYDTINTSIGAQSADTLTSQPIDLSFVSAGDTSVYLSFFYQAAGYGDYPNPGDSIILEFAHHAIVRDSGYGLDTIITNDTTIAVDTIVSVITGKDSTVFRDTTVKIDTTYLPDVNKKYFYLVDSAYWYYQWAQDGYNADPQQPFKQVLVPVRDTTYFKRNFQFRFRNFASTTGDNDQWNIDYVKLGTGRTPADTILDDVAIQKYSTGILSNYRELPWNQFQANPSGELRSNFTQYIRNNFSSSQTVNYNYTAEEITNSIPLNSSITTASIFQPTSDDSAQYSKYTTGPISSLTSPPIIKTIFTANSSNEGTVIFHNNDTCIEYQHFRNFFAYDDGSAERSYGLLGVGARGALKFHLNTPDTIQAVQIHFEHLISNQSIDLFSIVIWKSISPENEIYQQDFMRPTYIDTLNGFATYVLDTPFLVSDTIYVGWLQSQADVLDMGFDMNTDHHENLFYDLSPVSGTPWTNSSFPGSLMLHPFLGKRADLHLGTVNPITQTDNLILYPNPVENQLRIENLKQDVNFEVYSVLGSVVMSGRTNNASIDVNSLNEGIYFIKLYSNQNKLQQVYKFIKE